MSRNLEDKDDLYYLAYHDYLTGLTNEIYFKEELERKIENKYKKNKLAVLYLRVTNLARVNNILGYQKSDDLIINIAKNLNSLKSKLKSEIISLYKGEDFLILLNCGDDLKLIEEKINILETKIRNVFKDKDLDHLLKANIGISIYPDHGPDADLLLSRVHHAMYVAEESSKSYTFYNQKIFDEYLEKEKLQRDLKSAIQKNELFLKYQPLIDLKNNKIKALEALIRWKHPEKGIISPADFIPRAEKTGLIKKIGVFVLEEAFKQLQIWKNKRDKDFKICINISLIELKDQEIIKKIKTIASKYSFIPNHLIEFEITERAFAEISPSVLAELKNMDFSLSLDDFGTGYSSLNFLHKEPIDILKIDKSFIDNIDVEKTKLLLKTIIDLSHKLKLKVIAKGVETKNQYEKIKFLDCDYAQGFYFHRPLTVEKISKLLN